VFIVKDNQPALAADIRVHFAERGEPDFREQPELHHGRIESRAIWTSTALTDSLDVPHVGQVFAIEWHSIEKKTAKRSAEIVYGVTSHTPLESISSEQERTCEKGIKAFLRASMAPNAKRQAYSEPLSTLDARAENEHASPCESQQHQRDLASERLRLEIDSTSKAKNRSTWP
jgi:hypothetical protein